MKPINVYVVFCDGTIDARLESLTDEKSDSAELVLDGQLIGERAEEVNFAELLELAQREFDQAGSTVDETTLLAEWPALCGELHVAQMHWDADFQAINPQSLAINDSVQISPPVRCAVKPTQNMIPLWRTRLLRRFSGRHI